MSRISFIVNPAAGRVPESLYFNKLSSGRIHVTVASAE
jgi:hypothetical protein